MELPLRRAFADTRKSFGITWPSLARSILVPAAAVLLILYIRGFEDALNEAVDIALYVLAFCGAAVIPVFLWNLWLAPYRMMHERLDAAIAENKIGSPRGVSDYAGTTDFRLGEAACLWVDVEPQNPITDPAALAAFRRLGQAVVDGQIQEGDDSARLLRLMTDETWWPSYEHRVSIVALCRYADQVGDAPAFLAWFRVDGDDPAA